MTHARPMLALAATAWLAACSPPPPSAASRGGAPAAPAASVERPGSAATGLIHGSATYPERIKIAPGADFVVRLVDVDAPDAAIAQAVLEDVAGPPYPFALRYDPAKLRADTRYGLRASLRGPDGTLVFDTPSPVPVVPGGPDVEFRMQRVDAGDATPPSHTERTRWTCGGTTFDAVFDAAGGRVDLALPNGALSLPRAQSASGARYGDHRGNAFWTKGARGTFTRAGGGTSDCVRQDAEPAAGSPWQAAQARGIAFRAVGNEPGWYAEVGPGEMPALHAVLDYGERTLDVPRLQPLSGLLGYAGTSAEGTRVRLVLERKACSDGMSDATYPVTAILEVDAKAWRGCGRFLAE